MAKRAAKRDAKAWAVLTGQGVVMLSLVAGLLAFVGNGKSVQVVVDGQSNTVQTFGGTVAEVLRTANVTVTANDDVYPALAAAVDDGAAIQVNKAAAIEVELNGAETVVHTTGETVGELVTDLGVARDSDISAPAETPLVTLSSTLSISTPKTVTLAVDGKDRRIETTGNTVADLLTEAKVTLGDEDRVSVPVHSSLVTGMGLKVTRVETGKKVTETESIDFPSTEQEFAELLIGERGVVQVGVAGERTRVFTVTVIDGKETSREKVSDKVTREPVEEIVAVGTREEEPEPEPEEEKAPEVEAAAEAAPPVEIETPAHAPAAVVAGGGAWDALAECESGGNWSINTGNGYYGGLQFSASSWLGAGGGKYAPLPHQASRAEQIATAEVLKQNGGWGHWPSCSSKLGLR
ncbi:resuscitation-promoting factor [uncultured Arthrobacter sp.]|uniref:resuscitation-promoting factor n=1 Tax=uncultured Arthrobacter sp. TaxID=114050 RepID=UPI002638AE29|nr:resuscitation-promoting factor [uncultured Arthrobacter sp.]